MSRARVVWAEVARRDLRALVGYVADRSPASALRVLNRIEAAAGRPATHSGRGRVVPELARLHIRDYRELLIAPYRLLYRIAGGRVLVPGVFDSRGSLEDVLLDRIVRRDPDAQSGTWVTNLSGDMGNASHLDQRP